MRKYLHAKLKNVSFVSSKPEIPHNFSNKTSRSKTDFKYNSQRNHFKILSFKLKLKSSTALWDTMYTHFWGMTSCNGRANDTLNCAGSHPKHSNLLSTYLFYVPWIQFLCKLNKCIPYSLHNMFRPCRSPSDESFYIHTLLFLRGTQ
jgi:hypothetical protein